MTKYITKVYKTYNNLISEWLNEERCTALR